MTSVQEEADLCGLLQLPENCLFRITQFLSPLEACILAVVCKTLRAVVDSDLNWEPRIPKLADRSQKSLSKKDLYLRLRSGFILKDLSQPYWLDPDTGAGCYVLQSKALKIVWGDDERYWRWMKHQSSWSSEVNYLEDVCWLEVAGQCEIDFLPGEYTVSFRLMFTRHMSGWNSNPVEFKLSASNGYSSVSQRFFGDDDTKTISKDPAPLRKLGPWIEIDVGEIKVTEKMKLKLEFSMTEIEGQWWKSGIIVDCVKIQSSSAIQG